MCAAIIWGAGTHQKEQAKQSSKTMYDGNYSRAIVPTYLGNWQERFGGR